jgi:hypothetical protein
MVTPCVEPSEGSRTGGTQFVTIPTTYKFPLALFHNPSYDPAH